MRFRHVPKHDGISRTQVAAVGIGVSCDRSEDSSLAFCASGIDASDPSGAELPAPTAITIIGLLLSSRFSPDIKSE